MASLSCVRAIGVAPRLAHTHPRLRRPSRSSVRPCRPVAAAAAQEGDGPYDGEFGKFYITPADKLEVWAYRASLALVAGAFTAGTAASIAPDAAWAAALQQHGTALAAAGGVGMAGAVTLIHIYFTPAKRLLQLLLAAGLAGGAWLAVQHPEVPLPQYVSEHPGAVWLVGPAFAALTGICVKEGFCYEKRESWAAAAVLPLLMLCHLSGLMPAAGDEFLSAVASVLLLTFAGRKFAQAVPEDIGDKSVFEFYSMTDDQKMQRLEDIRLELAAYDDDEEEQPPAQQQQQQRQ